MYFLRVMACMFMAALLFSCGSKKRVVDNSPKKNRVEQPQNRVEATQKEHTSEKDYTENMAEAKDEPAPAEKSFDDINEAYIYKYAAIAKREMKLYGIPASITLAQGILESGAGFGELTSKSNNHFGIKCNGWEGAKVYHDDDRAQECFRKYKDPKYSFRDHSLFLANRGRYAFLFDLRKDNYKTWARGLKKAGYATDPRYPAKLIDLIERYNLDRFDAAVLGSSSKKKIVETAVSVDYSEEKYTVKNDDTLYGIAQKFDLTVEELKTMNNLNSNLIQVGQKLYVNKM